jgi:hypothetical protein
MNKANDDTSLLKEECAGEFIKTVWKRKINY